MWLYFILPNSTVCLSQLFFIGLTHGTYLQKTVFYVLRAHTFFSITGCCFNTNGNKLGELRFGVVSLKSDDIHFAVFSV